MKILVIGGMHGNEPLGLALIELLKTKPIANVTAVYANEPAIAANCRFVGADLNRSFPGDAKGNSYETRRAAELLALAESYDVVLDFHNTHCPNNDCGFVGAGAPAALYDVSAWLGLKRVIVADYDCINKYALNCLSVEISLDSPVMGASLWWQKIYELAQLAAVPASKSVQRYKFAYRMTLQDKRLVEQSGQQLRAFEPISPELAQGMGVASPCYPIFVNDAYTPYNFGGLLRKL